MAKGILGRKLGMTQIFDAAGNLIPVTVIDATPNVVLQQKTVENDGYVAVQLGYEDKRESLSNKPEKGHVLKANTAPKRFIREIRFSDDRGNELTSYNVGQEVKCDIFSAGDIVDVTGTSKGKGFAGTIKRYNHHRLPMSHGTSACHRIVGSMGPIKGNMKGKKMPGHMGNGNVRVTLQNLVIAAVDTERNLILVRGNVPGPKKGLVMIKTAVKSN